MSPCDFDSAGTSEKAVQLPKQHTTIEKSIEASALSAVQQYP